MVNSIETYLLTIALQSRGTVCRRFLRLYACLFQDDPPPPFGTGELSLGLVFTLR